MSDRNQMRVLFEGSSSDRRSSQNFDVIGQAVSEIFTAYGGIFFLLHSCNLVQLGQVVSV
jgi:hypothetical protein